MSFTLTGAGGPPAAAKQISPTGTTFDHTPTYTWKAVSDASWYYLWVNRGPDKKIAKWYKASSVGCGGGTGNCAITPNLSLTNGDYSWWIATWNNNGHGPWSSGMNFTITGTKNPPAATSLISPYGRITNRTPKYTWKAVSNSSWYYLWINKGPKKKFAKWYKASSVGCGNGTGSCSITPSTSLFNGDHTWWIRTWNSNGYGPWSISMNFNVQAGTNNVERFSSELNLAEPIKLGEELEVKLIITPESVHVGQKADLILVLEYWPTAKIADRMSFYRDTEGNWQIWTDADKLPPATHTYKELPAKIAETISLGVLELRGEYRWYAAYVLSDGTVVSSEPLVFVVE
jgi:hypothetical protein